MKIDITGCLHGSFPPLEGGDLLIVTGDLTKNHTCKEMTGFVDWYLSQPYRQRVFIAGNHDTMIEKGDYFNREWLGYLEDSGIEFNGLKIWGTPQSLWFDGINPKCKAFTGSESTLKNKYQSIPEGIDILVSHSPCYGILDQNIDGEHCGSKSLAQAVARTRPRLVAHSHIHESYGTWRPKLEFCGLEGYPIFVNASHMNERYEPINKPISIEL